MPGPRRRLAALYEGAMQWASLWPSGTIKSGVTRGTKRAIFPPPNSSSLLRPASSCAYFFHPRGAHPRARTLFDGNGLSRILAVPPSRPPEERPSSVPLAKLR